MKKEVDVVGDKPLESRKKLGNDELKRVQGGDRADIGISNRISPAIDP